VNVPQLKRSANLAAVRDAQPLLRRTRAKPATPVERLLSHLLSCGHVSDAEVHQASHLARVYKVPVTEVLLSEGWLSDTALLDARCACFSATQVRLDILELDKSLVHEAGLFWCLRNSLLPWRRLGGRVVWVTAEPEHFEDLAEDLPPAWGRPILGIARREDIALALATGFETSFVTSAESTLDARTSCRSWTAPQSASVLCAGACAVLFLTVKSHLAIAGLIALAVCVVAVNLLFKAVLTGAALMRRSPSITSSAGPGVLPRVSILVPLLQEAEIAGTLLNNLQRLRYPRALLEVILIVEADDDVTRTALSQFTLPQSFRVIDVPAGTVRTKPRALNYTLPFCRGEVIGIYDAEDKPEPRQLLKVAHAFETAGPEVACLQGRLDFFNTRTNLLTRCFTAEYAGWFGLQLQGLARLGWPVPLGGTTLFLRRDVLERVGGWDAHNVTEDADLGLRLHRAGYRTQVIDTVTDEEATSGLWPWVRQRSRWTKGYMMTYAVHMRQPLALWRDLGGSGFLAVQCLFLGSVLGALTMPFLFLMIGGMIGLPVPGMTPEALRTAGTAMLWLEGVNLLVWTAGIRARKHRGLLWVLPLLHVYFLLSSIAALKAMAELVTRPFFWDKTSHGISLDQTDS
jgi:glycosyltransferase involved in cell wall biosynthesis